MGYNADIILSSVKLRASMRGSENEKKGVEKLRRRYKKVKNIFKVIKSLVYHYLLLFLFFFKKFYARQSDLICKILVFN